MPADVAWRTLQILFFRAGPQDFPYDPRLTWTIPVLAVAANAAFLALVLPIGTSIGIAVAMVGMLALYTRTVLQARNLSNRFAQTLNALLATDVVLKLAMLPAFYSLAPKLAELAAHPEWWSDPDKMALPPLAALTTDVVSIWSFAVSANIYRHAANVGIPAGVLVALLALIVLVIGTTFASVFVRVLGG